MSAYLVGVLVSLVTDSILSSREAGSDGCVRVLSNRLVGHLRSFRASTLNGLSDVVDGVPVGLLVPVVSPSSLRW